MWNAVVWALSQAIKVVGIVGAWMLFKTLISHGSDTVGNLIETLEMGLEAGCYALKRKFFEMIKKEKAPITAEPAKNGDPVQTEGSVV